MIVFSFHAYHLIIPIWHGAAQAGYLRHRRHVDSMPFGPQIGKAIAKTNADHIKATNTRFIAYFPNLFRELLFPRSLIQRSVDLAPLQNEAQAIVDGARAQKACCAAMGKLINDGGQAIQHFEAG